MRNVTRLLLILWLAIAGQACQLNEADGPTLSAEQVERLMLGKWKVAQVNYQVCRNGNCTAVNYSGTAEDSFEFRSDSAFLYRSAATAITKPELFKTDYTLPGALKLTRQFWEATCEVQQDKQGNVVLVCSYAGSDPYAIFRDTYFLYR